MKRKYYSLFDYDNGRFIICSFLCTKFQGLGIIINTDYAEYTHGKQILFECNLLWFRLWMTFYKNKKTK